MSNSIINLSIKPVALKVAKAVSKLLTRAEKERVCSFAWYNGREKGISLLTDGTTQGTQTIVVINEHRCSDNITIDSYERKWIGNDQPWWKEAGYEAAYEKRVHFTYNDIEPAAKLAVKIIRVALAAEEARRTARRAVEKAGAK